jgi:hypothetical protein
MKRDYVAAANDGVEHPPSRERGARLYRFVQALIHAVVVSVEPGDEAPREEAFGEARKSLARHVRRAGPQPLPYDPVRDFAPVILLAKLPLIMTVTSSWPAQSVADVVALAKARPG